MRAIMILFDTLSRRYLENYGTDPASTPNFKRLEEHCVVFDRFYCGSMPCMPARRELHTGRYNFLHRSWGPLEPFDCSCIQLLHEYGIYTHLVTDHSHYFEDGGATYHNRYNTWEGFRGQEGDRYTPQKWSVPFYSNPKNKQGESVVQHYANRTRITCEEEMPSVQTITAGLSFLEKYKKEDNWFLQIECFSPHEPFFAWEKYRRMYGMDAKNTLFWPTYKPADGLSKEDLDQVQKEYKALITMCDTHLGRVLDFMDQEDMWKDTMLIVNTDHGFLLGEHGYMGKNYMPCYEELTHIPFFIHDPTIPSYGRRTGLSQTIDLAPTLLRYFHVEAPVDMDGKDLAAILKNDEPIHEDILFGIHGGHTCWSDGRYVLMKAPEGKNDIVEYTLMPTHMRGFFSFELCSTAALVPPSRYSNGMPCLRYVEKDASYPAPSKYGTLVFDLNRDPEQNEPIKDAQLQADLCGKLKQALLRVDAPKEEYDRLGL